MFDNDPTNVEVPDGRGNQVYLISVLSIN